MKQTINPTYKKVLSKILEERCLHNPKYSMRAFARDLGLSPARVSEILSGKQGLSKSRAQIVARRLGLTEQEVQSFSDSAEAKHGRSALMRHAAEKRLEKASPNELNESKFSVIADWQHFAILELCETAGFAWDIKKVSKQLGVHSEVVKGAVERLKELGLLIECRGELRPASEDTFSTDGVPSEALKRFHRQNLEKASTALAVQSVEERDFLTAYMAFDRNQIDEVRKIIREAQQKISAVKGSKSKRKNVYSLCVQFFKISENQEE